MAINTDPEMVRRAREQQLRAIEAHAKGRRAAELEHASRTDPAAEATAHDDSLGYFRSPGDAATAVRGVEALDLLRRAGEFVESAAMYFDQPAMADAGEELAAEIRALLGRTTTEEDDRG